MNHSTTYSDTLWGIRKLGESSEDLLALLNDKEDYLSAIRTFGLESRKQEWLAVRVLLKELLGQEKKINYTETGKPYLKDASYHLSVSHTKGYVAVIANPNHPVGIDIEQISPRINKIRSRFLNEEEEQNISKTFELTHLLLHWSAKETMFKMLAVSNVDFSKHFHLSRFEPQCGEMHSFYAFETRTEKKCEFLIRYFVHSEYVLTFAEL